MVTTGAEMPILNGIGSAASAVAVLNASARPSAAAVVRKKSDRMLLLPGVGARCDRAVRSYGLGIGVDPVNGAPVALGRLLDETPDAVLDGVEARLALHLEPARALDRNRDDVLDPPRPAGEHHDAVRQVDRLVDLMGDE